MSTSAIGDIFRPEKRTFDPTARAKREMSDGERSLTAAKWM